MTILTHERLIAVLDYDPGTGVFTWRSRPREEFNTLRAMKAWNALFAGRPAGSMPGRYMKIGIDYQMFQAHRLAWFHVTGRWPAVHIDHRNRNTSDNRWTNLREATPSQNQANRGLDKDNKSGAKGIRWREKRQRWLAQIGVRGQVIYLGEFVQKSDAMAAYEQAARMHFGEFARTV